MTFEQAWAPFLAEEGLAFANVLPADAVARAFAEEGVRFGTTPNAVFTPVLTLGAFRSQVIQEAQSCHAAVLRGATWLLAWQRTPCAEDTAASCRARAKLPAWVLRRLARDGGRNREGDVPAAWLWHGKHVQLVDGTPPDLARPGGHSTGLIPVLTGMPSNSWMR